MILQRTLTSVAASLPQVFARSFLDHQDKNEGQATKQPAEEAQASQEKSTGPGGHGDLDPRGRRESGPASRDIK